MTVNFQREIDRLKRRILTLGAMVEENLQRSLRSVLNRDTALAIQTIKTDTEIDEMEVEIEEDCLKILALHQPVAIDLRFIIAVLKINNDLERIGDLAVNLAERAQYLTMRERVPLPYDLTEIAQLAQTMLRGCLDALVNFDAELAKQVVEMDDEIDAMHRSTYSKVEAAIRRDPEHMDIYINSLAFSRQLERVGDHATNIAEDVLYMIQGEIVRHQRQPQ